jgi:hypothetical protein
MCFRLYPRSQKRFTLKGRSPDLHLYSTSHQFFDSGVSSNKVSIQTKLTVAGTVLDLHQIPFSSLFKKKLKQKYGFN